MKHQLHIVRPQAQYCSCGQDAVTCQGCGRQVCGEIAQWVEGKGNIGPCCKEEK